MARLNDLPTPAESVEALKRRFVRQNREIARANSLQSLRIQNLESEVSRLLGENTSLRAQLASLGHDARKYETAKLLHDGVYDLKEKLDIKLVEMCDLVKELGMLPRKASRGYEPRPSSDRQKASIVYERRLANQLYEVEEDGRLPVILEDKYFPRKSLESHEIFNPESDAASLLDSPNIGPPPVAHLDVEDSLGPTFLAEDFQFTKIKKVDTERERDITLLATDTDLTDDNSKGTRNSSKEKFTIEKSGTELTGRPIKSGSKRKFSSRDEDDKFLSSLNIMVDDFQFSCPVDMSREGQKEIVAPNSDLPCEYKQSAGEESKKERISKRKALEPKSTNVQHSSPKRRSADIIGRKDQVNVDSLEGKACHDTATSKTKKDKTGTPDQRLSRGEFESKRAERSTIEEIQPPAPAKEAIPHSELNESGNLRHQDISELDTCPPGLASRPTRRQRGNVSYAEPNLRDKMRRPTNELVDAVGADRFRRASSSQAERKSFIDEDLRTNVPKTDPKTTTLGAEDSEDPNNIEPFHSLPQLPKTVNTERKRRTLSANKEELVRPCDPDANLGSFSASLLLRTTDRRRRRESGRPYINMNSEMSGRQMCMQNLEADDGPELSDLAIESDNNIFSTTQPSRQQSSDSGSTQREKLTKFDVKQHVPSHRLYIPEKLSERAENESDLPSQSTWERRRLDEDDNTEREKSSETRWGRFTGGSEVQGTGITAGPTKRAQRSGVRRRSMML